MIKNTLLILLGFGVFFGGQFIAIWLEDKDRIWTILLLFFLGVAILVVLGWIMFF